MAARDERTHRSDRVNHYTAESFDVVGVTGHDRLSPRPCAQSDGRIDHVTRPAVDTSHLEGRPHRSSRRCQIGHGRVDGITATQEQEMRLHDGAPERRLEGHRVGGGLWRVALQR